MRESCQQHARHVGAYQEQQKPDGGLQDPERRPNASNHVTQRGNDKMALAIVWIYLDQSGGGDIQLGGGDF